MVFRGHKSQGTLEVGCGAHLLTLMKSETSEKILRVEKFTLIYYAFESAISTQNWKVEKFNKLV